MPKLQLTERDVICLVKEALGREVDLDSERPTLVDEDEGTEHTCWLLNDALVLRAKPFIDLHQRQETIQQDELKALQREGKLKYLVKDLALKAHSASFETIARSVPISVATAIWQRNSGSNHSSRQNVLFSIEERKHGNSLDPKPKSTESSLTLDLRTWSNITDELCDLLKLLKMPALVERARELGIPMHEAIDLHSLVPQSQNMLSTLISQPSPESKNESEEYKEWQAHLGWDAAWSLCKTIASSSSIPSSGTRNSDGLDDEIALLHADLKGEHIITYNGSLSGILDWSDAALGPGFIDVAGLVISVGASLAVKSALQAGYSLLSCVRGVLFARSRCVLYLHQQEGPTWLLVRQARRAFQNAEPVLY